MKSGAAGKRRDLGAPTSKEAIMRVPHTGHRIVSALAGVLLAGTVLAVPGAAAAGPADSTGEPARAAAPAGTVGRVIDPSGVDVHDEPNTSSRLIATLPYGTTVALRCKIQGETVDDNPRWYRLSDRDGYVPARWVKIISGLPVWC